MPKTRNCLLVNIAAHYRYAIYKKMAEELSFDLYYGTSLYQKDSIKSMDFSGFTTEYHPVNNVVFPHSNWYWQRNIIGLLRMYDTFIISGETFCISTWIMCFINKLFFKKRIIFWTQGVYKKDFYIKKTLKKIFFSLADRLLVYGDYAISFMKQEGYNSQIMFPIHNSLNYDEQCKVISKIPPPKIPFFLSFIMIILQ